MVVEQSAEQPPRKRTWKRARQIVARVLILLALLVVVDYFGYPYGAAPAGFAHNRGENGLWLRYTWYLGEHTDADVRAMCARLLRQEITFAYFHVRSIQK